MTDKLRALLGFASKAGALRFGFKETAAAVKRGRAECVVLSGDVSAKSRKEILFYCDKFGVKAFELKGDKIEDLSKCVGKRCGVLAVTTDDFANPIISNLTSDI